MEALASIVAFFVSMVCLMMFFSWIGFRVFPYLKNSFIAFSKGASFVFKPLFHVVLFCGKLLFKLGKRFAIHFTKSAEPKLKVQPVIAKHHMVAIRKDRLCQFDI